MYRRRTRGAALGTVALLASAMAASSAFAATPPTVTETFASTGAEQSFTVPAGVSSVGIEAIGAAGEAGLSFEGHMGGAGGTGAVVIGQLPVSAGEVLYVEVAGHGFDGGGNGLFGGGSGGDASDVRTVPMASAGSPGSRLLVAAGGGGGGGVFFGSSGGPGGNAGSPGTNGTKAVNETSSVASAGGGAGTLTGGGAGGAACQFSGPWNGVSGTLGLGGNGGFGFGAPQTGGGGGGGGYFGGGGGEGTCITTGPEATGGGGGGGSSFVYGGATFSSFNAAAPSTVPSVSITYPTPATATPDTTAITFPATQPQQTLSPPQTITLTNEGGNSLLIDGTTFADSTPSLTTDHPEDFLIGSSSCMGPISFESTCRLTVRFAPQGEGVRTATLQIAGNTGAGPTVIALSGTGGTLPQGPTGATGSEGPTGATGTTGAPGATGVAGATGTEGAAGAPGIQGQVGVAGSTGPQGPAGNTGTAGPPGPIGATGPQGQTAVEICHRRQLDGRFVQACFVRILSAHGSLLGAKLIRDDVVYARAGSSGSGRQLELSSRQAVSGGRYTLVLISRSATVRERVTVR